ncbi:MAG TPA: GNAT family protein [Chloroflexota bacterium]|nr:GNAT family protein [Chloroflexota bacterium]
MQDGGAGATEPPTINIRGQLVALGPWRRELVPLYLRWDNDYGTKRTDDPGAARPITLEEGYNEYDEWVRSPPARRIRFTVYELSSWRPIGMCGLRDLDWQSRNAVFGISIGEPDCRGKGYGTEATILTLDQAFIVMGLNTVLLDVLATNRAGLRAYAKAGFREIGRWRESALVNRQYVDTVFMECLAKEFTSPVLAQIFTTDR